MPTTILECLIIFVKIVFSAWLGCVLYTVYGLNYPERCRFLPASKEYKQSCLEPFLRRDSIINLNFVVGIPGLDASYTEIWSLKNYSVGSEVDVEIKVPIPDTVRTEGDLLRGWLVFDIPNAIPAYLHTPIIAAVDLTVNKPLKHSNQKKLLLKDTTSSNSHKNIISEENLALDRNHPHWKYSLQYLIIRTIHLDDIVLPHEFLPHMIHKVQARYYNGRQPTYDPILLVDELSLQARNVFPMNRNVSTPHPKLKLKIVPTTNIYFGFKKLVSTMLDFMSSVFREEEMEEMKFWFSDDYLCRYLLSQLIIWIHIIFEYLAFRQDWQFFVGRKSFAGISSSSLIMSVVRSGIIFLYLYDAGTSSIILVSIAKDFFYGAWKVYKILKSRMHVVKSADGWHSLQNRDPARMGERERLTAQYDRIATLSCGLCVYPMVLGLALYSLVYYSYKSWFSWAVSSLADSVYMFGFISLTPQLYINYKLKSVAHLPLRAFGYKMFATFVDDVFAFIVKMPMKHRIMCLRDDVVFLGFLYQWFMYPVDKTRPNEFGFQYEKKQRKIKDPQSLLVTDKDDYSTAVTSPEEVAAKEEKEEGEAKSNDCATMTLPHEVGELDTKTDSHDNITANMSPTEIAAIGADTNITAGTVLSS